MKLAYICFGILLIHGLILEAKEFACEQRAYNCGEEKVTAQVLPAKIFNLKSGAAVTFFI